MERRNLYIVASLALTVAGCATVEQRLQDETPLFLSNREVREIFQGNTVSAASGETFYWDADGTVIGRGSYGGTVKGNWNITDDGRLCVSNWNSNSAPAGCYRVYFDNSTRQRKVVDMSGGLKYTIATVVTGNPNIF